MSTIIRWGSEAAGWPVTENEISGLSGRGQIKVGAVRSTEVCFGGLRNSWVKIPFLRKICKKIYWFEGRDIQ